MTTNATPSAAAAPTAAPSSSAGAASTSTPSSSSSGGMSTADFKRTILNKPTPKPSPVVSPAPEPVSTGLDFSQDAGQDDDASGDAGDFAQESVEQQTASADDSETPDWSWAEGLKDYRDGLHGVATQELLQALAAGQIPEALMDKLSLTMKDGDEEWTGTVADLKNGAQMHSTFTKKSQALAKEKQDFYGERSELVDYFRSWKEDETGEKGLLGLEKMLGETAVYKIAEQLATRLQRKEQLEAAEAAGHIPPGTAKIIMERESLQREVEETRRYKARQEAAQQEKEVNTHAVDVGKRLNQEAVNQFKLAGIAGEDLTTGMWSLFKEELSSLWTDPNHTPGPVEVRTAVMAAKQRAERIVRQHRDELAKKQPVGAKPLTTGTAPAGGAGVPKRTAGTGNKAISTADFKKKFMNTGRPFSGR